MQGMEIRTFAQLYLAKKIKQSIADELAAKQATINLMRNVPAGERSVGDLESISDFTKNIDFFKKLPEQVSFQLGQCLEFKETSTPDEEILKRSESKNCMMFVLEGSVVEVDDTNPLNPRLLKKYHAGDSYNVSTDFDGTDAIFLDEGDEDDMSDLEAGEINDVEDEEDFADFVDFTPATSRTNFTSGTGHRTGRSNRTSNTARSSKRKSKSSLGNTLINGPSAPTQILILRTEDLKSLLEVPLDEVDYIGEGVKFLKQLNPFNILATRQLEKFARHFDIPRNTLFIQENGEEERILVVTNGEYSVSKRVFEKNVELLIRGPGLCNVEATLSGKPAGFTCTTTTDVHLVSFRLKDLTRIHRDFGSKLLASTQPLMAILNERISKLTEMVMGAEERAQRQVSELTFDTKPLQETPLLRSTTHFAPSITLPEQTPPLPPKRLRATSNFEENHSYMNMKSGRPISATGLSGLTGRSGLSLALSAGGKNKSNRVFKPSSISGKSKSRSINAHPSRLKPLTHAGSLKGTNLLRLAEFVEEDSMIDDETKFKDGSVFESKSCFASSGPPTYSKSLMGTMGSSQINLNSKSMMMLPKNNNNNYSSHSQKSLKNPFNTSFSIMDDIPNSSGPVIGSEGCVSVMDSTCENEMGQNQQQQQQEEEENEDYIQEEDTQNSVGGGIPTPIVTSLPPKRSLNGLSNSIVTGSNEDHTATSVVIDMPNSATKFTNDSQETIHFRLPSMSGISITMIDSLSEKNIGYTPVINHGVEERSTISTWGDKPLLDEPASPSFNSNDSSSDTKQQQQKQRLPSSRRGKRQPDLSARLHHQGPSPGLKSIWSANRPKSSKLSATNTKSSAPVGQIRPISSPVIQNPLSVNGASSRSSKFALSQKLNSPIQNSDIPPNPATPWIPGRNRTPSIPYVPALQTRTHNKPVTPPYRPNSIGQSSIHIPLRSNVSTPFTVTNRSNKSTNLNNITNRTTSTKTPLNRTIPTVPSVQLNDSIDPTKFAKMARDLSNVDLIGHVSLFKKSLSTTVLQT